MSVAGHHFAKRQPADTWSLPLQKREENYFLLTPQENDLREVHVSARGEGKTTIQGKNTRMPPETKL